MRTVRENIFLAFILLFAPLAVFAQSGGGSTLNITSLTSALLLIAVVLGVLVNLWKITRKYGGVIGKGLRLIGTGIVFLSIEALDRAVESLATEGIIGGIIAEPFTRVAHDLILVLALFFVTLGFVKFYSATQH